MSCSSLSTMKIWAKSNFRPLPSYFPFLWTGTLKDLGKNISNRTKRLFWILSKFSFVCISNPMNANAIKGRVSRLGACASYNVERSTSLFIKQSEACGWLFQENCHWQFAVIRENLTIAVRFLIRISFVCSDFMRKVHFHFGTNHIYFST